MFVYSKTLNAFLKRLKEKAFQIAHHEMKLDVSCTFIKLPHGQYFPLRIVAFENPRTLGYFDWESSIIGINKCLLYKANPRVLDNILRHELAHMHCDSFFKLPRFQRGLEIPDNCTAHGWRYRQTCEQFGWGPEVFNAYSDLTVENTNHPDAEYEKIYNRIRKLLNLSSSSNPHESQVATLKANQILLKHNVSLLNDMKTSYTENDQEIFVKTIYTKGRANAQMQALSRILSYFYVSPVYDRKETTTHLTVTGTRLNVKLADYIGKFFLNETERLWHLAQKKDPALKGIVKKNSYISGLASGVITKIKQERKKESAESKMALVKVEKVLDEQLSLAYPNLSSTRRSGSFDGHAHNLGEQDGQSISFRKGIEESSSKTYYLEWLPSNIDPTRCKTSAKSLSGASIIKLRILPNALAGAN